MIKKSVRSTTIRARKRLFKKALIIPDFSVIIAEPRAFGPLVSLMYDADAIVRWRSLDALRQLAAYLAKTDLESVREILRRLFWAMNDESGGFIWMAPEAAAHILEIVPELHDEYASMLLSHHDLPCFKSGVYYAARVISCINPKIVLVWKKELAIGLESDKAEDRAHISVALKNSDPDFYHQALALSATPDIDDDNSMFEYYDFESGKFLTCTVAGYIDKLGK